MAFKRDPIKCKRCKTDVTFALSSRGTCPSCYEAKRKLTSTCPGCREGSQSPPAGFEHALSSGLCFDCAPMHTFKQDVERTTFSTYVSDGDTYTAMREFEKLQEKHRREHIDKPI